MCHNSELDQTITRADFNVDELATLPRSELDTAIARLMLPADDIRKMPPESLHELSSQQQAAAISVLSQ
jgi:hypothetical protein